MGDFTWGGFITENIKRWLVTECYESGDPRNFLRAIEDVIEMLNDDIDTLETGSDVDKYWEDIYTLYKR